MGLRIAGSDPPLPLITARWACPEISAVLHPKPALTPTPPPHHPYRPYHPTTTVCLISALCPLILLHLQTTPHATHTRAYTTYVCHTHAGTTYVCHTHATICQPSALRQCAIQWGAPSTPPSQSLPRTALNAWFGLVWNNSGTCKGSLGFGNGAQRQHGFACLEGSAWRGGLQPLGSQQLRALARLEMRPAGLSECSFDVKNATGHGKRPAADLERWC